MALTPLDENAKTLAAALGLEEDQAAELLNIAVHITFDENDPLAVKFASHVEVLLSRTIHRVLKNDVPADERIQAEFVIGDARRRCAVPTAFARLLQERILIGPYSPEIDPGRIHGVGLILGACYAVAAILQLALKRGLPFPTPEIYDIDLAKLLGDDLSLLYQAVSFDEAYLAGAGAIGNAFVYALSEFDADGTLNVADPDSVSAGNVQRCVFFESGDVTHPKAERLCAAIERTLTKVKAIPHVRRLQEVPARDPIRGWLKRLIVAVDSPRARRSLQGEIPGEVFDASTTGITEVALHFHHQPTDSACLSCAYHHTPEENTHDRHVAEALGVSVDEVQENYISPQSAEVIMKRFPKLNENEVSGAAYDTLYKQLCATKRLLDAPEDRQVLAPFAFVSMLAGTLLAIEFVRRIRRGHGALFNEWRVSAWWPPLLRCQRRSPRKPDCVFCGNLILRRTTKKFWDSSAVARLPQISISVIPDPPAIARPPARSP